MSLQRVYDAPKAFKHLNGLINIYKPAGKSVSQVRRAILSNLCRDLNQLEVREPRTQLCIEPGGGQNPVVRKIVDLSDHILAVGPRYQMTDIHSSLVASLGPHTSGVLLMGINRGTSLTSKIHLTRPLRVYHVTGKLGFATESNFSDSRKTATSSYNHITSEKIAGLASSLQASHQRKMFEICGVDLQSQAAYEIASKGAIRPADNSQPVIYGIKLVSFDRHEFTLEIHSINETESYLGALIHDMAIELRSVAHCKGIRCIRHGHFSVEESLLRRHWTLDGVFSNISVTARILRDHPKLLHRRDVQLTTD